MMVEATEREEQHEDGQSMMLELAKQVEDHYTRPSPAAEYRPNFFPELLDHGIFWGILLGAVAGILFAWLVHTGRVTPTGWEGLFSLVPFSFYSFFAFVGGALGLLVGGVITVLAAPAPDVRQEEGEADTVIVTDEEESAVVVEHNI